MGKLASAPALFIKQCLQHSNWTVSFICSKKENKFCVFSPSVLTNLSFDIWLELVAFLVV